MYFKVYFSDPTQTGFGPGPNRFRAKPVWEVTVANRFGSRPGPNQPETEIWPPLLDYQPR